MIYNMEKYYTKENITKLVNYFSTKTSPLKAVVEANKFFVNENVDINLIHKLGLKRTNRRHINLKSTKENILNEIVISKGKIKA